MQELAFITAGLLVGAVVGLTGVGGGSLMTPLLVFGFGVKPYLAVGTDLLFAAATKFGGTVRLARAGLVDWRIVAHLSAGSIPASLLTLLVLQWLGPTSATVQHAITRGLGLALLLTAAATLYKALRGRNDARQHRQHAATQHQQADRQYHPHPVTQPQAGVQAQPTRPRHWSLPLLFGAAIGALVTLTSVGAGAIGVTVLLLLYPLLPLPRIVAADIAYAVPLTLIAGLGHASMGSVDWSLLALLLTGSLPGIWVGSRLMQHTPERVVRALLSALLAYAGSKLVML